PLFNIDPRPYQATLDLAKAKKDNATAGFNLAEAEYKRIAALFKKDAASAREMDIWVAKKATALAEIGQADAEIDQAKLDLEFADIKAPITGRISRTQVTKGNLVEKGGGGTMLTTLVSVDPMYVYFDVDEAKLQLYRERRAEADADKGKPPV